MKIAFVNSNLFWGGAEKWHVRAAIYLASRGHEIYFFARSEEVVRQLRGKENIQVRLFPFKNDFDIYTVFRLFFHFIRSKPHVVFFNSERDLRIGGAAASLAGIKIRVHRKGISGIKNKPRYRWIYRHLKSHTLCVADAVRVEIDKLGWVSPESLKVIYSGVDLDEFSQTGTRNLRIELGLKDNEILVGALARLSSIKGLEYLIDAAAAIKKDAIPVKFAIVGAGRLESELKDRAAKLGLGETLIFTGFRSDAADALRSFDVCVLPSVHSEGFSNSVIEAMACARPVVGTTVAGTPEAVVDGETGILVPPRDAQSLANAISILAGDDLLRKRMGEAGRARAEKSFDYRKKFGELESWIIGLPFGRR